MPNSLEHISTQTVSGSSVNRVSFTGLSATYKTFVVKGYFCSNSNSTSDFMNNDFYIRLNSDPDVVSSVYQRSAAITYGNPNGGSRYYYNGGGVAQFQLSGAREKYNSDLTKSWQSFEMEILPYSASGDDFTTVFYQTAAQNGISQDAINWVGTGRYYNTAAITSVQLFWNSASMYYLPLSYFSVYGIKES
jgi:hypothetical protein|tara:strand:- start:235 stop:807 length:573 start_codon:yes stop_codon:yes gene_type:complete